MRRDDLGRAWGEMSWRDLPQLTAASAPRSARRLPGTCSRLRRRHGAEHRHAADASQPNARTMYVRGLCRRCRRRVRGGTGAVACAGRRYQRCGDCGHDAQGHTIGAASLSRRAPNPIVDGGCGWTSYCVATRCVHPPSCAARFCMPPANSSVNRGPERNARTRATDLHAATPVLTFRPLALKRCTTYSHV